MLTGVFQRLRQQPRRVVFAEGEEEQVIRAAATFVHQGLGSALLVGRERAVRETAQALGVELGGGIEIINAAISKRNANYAAYLYERLQRQGYLQRDCQRMVNQDRNHFAACMVALGDADAMVTGVTRNFSVALEEVLRCIDPKPGHRVMGMSLVLARGRTVLVADTAVDRTAERERPRRYRNRGGARRALAGLRSARCVSCRSRRSAIRRASARSASRKPCGFSMNGGLVSNTTAKWPPTWR